MTKVCEICGREFETSQPHKLYCSFMCKESGQILKRMEWEREHPSYNTLYKRKLKSQNALY